jgi:Holliday junction resolvase RusA-like endonuclease
MARRIVTFTVVGRAQPMGSTKAFVPKAWAQKAVAAGTTPRAIVTSDNPRLKEWQGLVAQAAKDVVADGMFVGPIAVYVRFFLARPMSLPRSVIHHVKTPDLDKLLRSTNDALAGVLFADDRQITRLVADKFYAAGVSAPHAIITVLEAAPPPLVEGDLFAEETT